MSAHHYVCDCGRTAVEVEEPATYPYSNDSDQAQCNVCGTYVREYAELDDPFLRYRDKILRTLEYISNNAGSNDHGVEIAEMATELLGDLEVE